MYSNFKERSIYVGFFFLLILVVLFLNPFGVGDSVRRAIGTVSSPVISFGSTLGHRADSFFGAIGRMYSLQSRYGELQKEVDLLRARGALGDDIIAENNRLREELSFPVREKVQGLGADVIGRDSHSGGEWIMINRGSRDGIGPGMSVIVGDAIFVGKVSEVFAHSSRVLLVTHGESVSTGFSASGGVQMLIQGDHGIGLLARDIPRNFTEDDDRRILVMHERDGLASTPLLIGVIRELHDGEDQLTKEAKLEPAYSSDFLRHVFVLTDL